MPSSVNLVKEETVAPRHDEHQNARNGPYSHRLLAQCSKNAEMGALIEKLRKPRSSASNVPKSRSANNCLTRPVPLTNGRLPPSPLVNGSSTNGHSLPTAPSSNGQPQPGLPPSGLRSSRTCSVSSIACRPAYRSVAYKTWSVNGAREYPRFFRSQTDLTAADLLCSSAAMVVDDATSTLPPPPTTISSVTLTRKKITAAAAAPHQDYGSMDRARTKSLTINRGKLTGPVTVYDDRTDFYSSKDYCNFSQQKSGDVKNSTLKNSGWGNSLRRLARFRSQSPFAIIRSPSSLVRKLKDTLTSNSTFSLHSSKYDKNNNVSFDDDYKFKTFGLSEQTSSINKFRIRSNCDLENDQDSMDNNQDPIYGTYFFRSFNQSRECGDNRNDIKKGYSLDSSSIHTDSGSSTSTVKFGTREEAIDYVKSQLMSIRQRDEEILRQLQNIEARIRLNNAC